MVCGCLELVLSVWHTDGTRSRLAVSRSRRAVVQARFMMEPYVRILEQTGGIAKSAHVRVRTLKHMICTTDGTDLRYFEVVATVPMGGMP